MSQSRKTNRQGTPVKSSSAANNNARPSSSPTSRSIKYLTFLLLFLVFLAVWILVFHHPEVSDITSALDYKLHHLKIISPTVDSSHWRPGSTSIRVKHVDHHNSLVQEHFEKSKHVQQLYDSTKEILRELIKANISLREVPVSSYTSIEEQLDRILNPVRAPQLLINEKESQLQEKLPVKTKLETVWNEFRRSNFSRNHQLNMTDSSRNHNNSNHKWLVVGIPTVARPGNEDYLLRSLHTMRKELPTSPGSFLFNQVVIVIVNVDGPNHQRFYEAKERFKDSNYFQFTELEKSEVLLDAKPNSNPLRDVGNANIPGYRVRKQTRNLVSIVRKSARMGSFYLFLEDDMEFCAKGFEAIHYLLDKAERYHPNWLAIRASYGMNGIFMRQSDVLVFADYLLKHQVRRPPDHLVVEWFAGETKESKAYKGLRANIGYRFNLFDHIGIISSLRKERQGTFPRCYDLLLEPTVFQVEAFNIEQCPRDDIWPCNVKHPDDSFVHWGHHKED